jgi:hypothetical protein
VQRHLIDIASQWTASGCVQPANRLLPLARETGDLSTFTIPLAAFEIPWSQSRTRPTTWAPSAQDTDAIELDLWERLFGQQWTDATVDRVKSARPEELRGNSMLIRAVITAYDGSRSDRVAAPDRLAEAAALLDRFLDSPEAVGYTLFQALRRRVTVATRLGDVERANKNLLTWAGATTRFLRTGLPGTP